MQALWAAIAEAGTIAKWARANGVSPQYTHDVVASHREPGDKILEALGFERVHIYRRTS